ncbi:MAG: hypothetical protein HYU63_06645 [Armatimonadetes bacterium]|nr:hypothetical protein [Armatimonadota bacterium]
MRLRRGFKILPFSRVLVLEDVITTGKSTQELIQVVKEYKGIISGIGALIDRSSEELDLPLKPKSLLKIKVNTYQAEECPFCKENIPLIKPGSRIF